MRGWLAMFGLELRRMWLTVAAYVIGMVILHKFVIYYAHEVSSFERGGQTKQLLMLFDHYIPDFAPALLFFIPAVIDHLSGKRRLLHSLPMYYWSHVLAKAAAILLLLIGFESLPLIKRYLVDHVSDPGSVDMFYITMVSFSYEYAIGIAAGMFAYTAAVALRRMSVAAGMVTLVLGIWLLPSIILVSPHGRQVTGLPLLGYYSVDIIPALFTAVAALWLYNRFSEV